MCDMAVSTNMVLSNPESNLESTYENGRGTLIVHLHMIKPSGNNMIVENNKYD